MFWVGRIDVSRKMSAKTTALNNLIQAFKRWPNDANRVYFSFKEFQSKKLQESLTGSHANLPSAEKLEQQAAATRLLTSDSNKRKVSWFILMFIYRF